jgi:chemotaxis protein CheX
LSNLETLDLEMCVTSAVEDVFGTMLSIEVTKIPPGEVAANGHPQIVGTVSLAGSILGNVNVHLNRRFACLITAAILGMEIGDIAGDDEVHDVIGEVCNMVGGKLKSRLCDAGLACELSIPTITAGSDFRIESKGWKRHERFGFRNNEDTALVEVFMKHGDR